MEGRWLDEYCNSCGEKINTWDKRISKTLAYKYPLCEKCIAKEYDMEVKRVRVVANKVRGPEDEEFVRSKIPAEDLLGFIHYNTDVIDADRQGRSPYDISREATEEIRKIKELLEK